MRTPRFFKNFKKYALASILAVALTLTSLPVAADLMVLPIRTVFKDRDRSKSISLINGSNESGTFRLEFYNQKQVESGGYEPLTAANDSPYDLSKMLVFSPRQVTLPGRGKQSIRLSVRKPADLPDGEYRTHLKLKKVSDRLLDSPEKKATVGVNVNISFSVPIILRQGKYDATAQISDFKYLPSVDPKKPPRVEFKLNRQGKYSTLGRVKIFWTPPKGAEKQVGLLNSVSVFTEITQRSVSVNLNDPHISTGTFRVLYEGDDADTGITFDEKSFPVAG